MRFFPEVKMGMVKLAGACSVLVASQAMGASSVIFSLGLQNSCPGSNYATYKTNWKNDLTPMSQFPAGNQSNGQTYTSPVTWDVTLTASGVQAAGNGAGSAIYGVANFVYDLEVHAGTAGGPIVTTATFSSQVNDGTSGDPSASAAFTASSNLLGLGFGRVIDTAVKGGPNMGVFTYPTNPSNGTLLGMGAGYSQWNRSGGAAVITQPGVGMTTLPNGQAGVGIVPVTEGQLTLPAGTYTLVVKPGAGVNVLRGDINLMQSQNAFAVAADQTAGSNITFTISGPCGAQSNIALTGAASRRTHNAVDYDIPLALTGADREPRQAGVSPKVVLNFDSAPTGLGCGDLTVTGSSCSSVVVSGNSAIVTLAGGLVKNSCLTVNVNSVPGKTLAGDTNVSCSLHEGNVNTSGPSAGINLIDMNDVKAALFLPVTASNFKLDVNLSNSINLVDMNAVKSNLFFAAAACP